jgi:thymidylate synthase (FAD)
MAALVTKMPVFDHGFVILRNLAGPTRRLYDEELRSNMDGSAQGYVQIEREFDADDIDPANAARMSFDQMDSDRTREEDLKLCNYLMKNKHSSPFEMIQVWLEIKMPIFIARQFVRHRTQSLNEVSGRYATLPAEWYVPEVVGGKAKNVKQGQADNLDDNCQMEFKAYLENHCKTGYAHYLTAMHNGVAPEHARMFLSLNHYTHWLSSTNLHNLMHFLSLRTDSHAQIEAQKYAEAIITLVRMRLPHCMELFDKYRRLS